MAIKAVGFDIDGTLYPDFRAHLRSMPFFLSHIRIILAFARTRGLMRETEDDFDESEAKIFAGELGCDLEKARKIRDRIIFKGWEARFCGMKIYPGVRDALIRLKAAGLKIAALSDFPVGRKLEYFGIEELFDVILGFPESRRLKPRPEPFLVMTERLGLNPDEILYVGNKLDFDVRGAENAGMRGALIGPPGRKAPRGVTTFTDYRHMAESILSEVTT